MPRYRRVNIDGQSLYKTETRTTAAALLPGTAATINSSDEFAQATALSGHRPQRHEVRLHRGNTRHSAQYLERRHCAAPVALPHCDSGGTGQSTMDGQQHQTEHRQHGISDRRGVQRRHLPIRTAPDQPNPATVPGFFMESI